MVYFVRIFPVCKRQQARNCRKHRYSHIVKRKVNDNYSGLLKTTVHFDTRANSLNFALRNIVNSITDRSCHFWVTRLKFKVCLWEQKLGLKLRFLFSCSFNKEQKTGKKEGDCKEQWVCEEGTRREEGLGQRLLNTGPIHNEGQNV